MPGPTGRVYRCYPPATRSTGTRCNNLCVSILKSESSTKYIEAVWAAGYQAICSGICVGLGAGKDELPLSDWSGGTHGAGIALITLFSLRALLASVAFIPGISLRPPFSPIPLRPLDALLTLRTLLPLRPSITLWPRFSLFPNLIPGDRQLVVVSNFGDP